MFATLGQADAQLFVALARAAERNLGDFSPQDLANTAWAFATLGQADAQLEAWGWSSALCDAVVVVVVVVVVVAVVVSFFVLPKQTKSLFWLKFWLKRKTKKQKKK